MQSRWSNPIPQTLQQHGGTSKHPIEGHPATVLESDAVDIVEAWDRLERRFSGFASSPILDTE